MFSRKYKNKEFCCGHNILTEGVFVTQLSSNAGISVGRIVWVMTNCCFVSDILISFLEWLSDMIFFRNVAT